MSDGVERRMRSASPRYDSGPVGGGEDFNYNNYMGVPIFVIIITLTI